jgi:general secretion pathway protein G
LRAILLAEDWKALADLPDSKAPGKTVRSSSRIEIVPPSRSVRARTAYLQAGFTLIELLIAMMIVITLSAIAIPSLMASIYQAKIARAVGDIHAIEDDIAFYQVINGQLPDDLSQAGDGNLLDPWGNPYQYLNHATMKGNGHARKDRFLVPLNDDYDLYSMGRDGASVPPLTAKASQDDIVRAASGGYVGLASQF